MGWRAHFFLVALSLLGRGVDARAALDLNVPVCPQQMQPLSLRMLSFSYQSPAASEGGGGGVTCSAATLRSSSLMRPAMSGGDGCG